MRRRLAVAIGALTLMLSALVVAAPAHAQGVRVGVLTCNVSSGFGFVFGSSRSLNCTFSGPNHHYEHYMGTINRFGVDIGYINGGVLVWSVLAPTATPAPCALAGNYGGATAQATVGVGAGANVLVGGSGNSVSLQPLSIEGTTGLNVAAGIASITLQCAPGP
ncbi:MAG TPA: DUF992 domain-containing protein [Stellaceae bacterium]|nr:DUF992 domain-containing protein [Stellaceae bacterium]